jgi:hypothetical protein
MVTDMLNENKNPYLLLTDQQFQLGRGGLNHKKYRIKVSVRELEAMAANLRQGGDNRKADEIDREIMEILERKICRKIIKRSRKEQKLIYLGLA